MTTKSRYPILHIVVVGFHHKKGCQVEFSYPPLIPEKLDDHTACPSGWKYLPTLALPDGSHNFSDDSVFFNLPSLLDPNESIYGVSCYRQIPVEELKIRTADVTRSTVQKSVCALASIPVYGYIEVKLSLIAHAFFEQGDFSAVDILVQAYNQLNACLTPTSIDNFESDDILEGNSTSHLSFNHHLYVGLPLRDIVLRWRYKTLILFKLMLLQRKVVCFGSPVRPICSLILAISSLHPNLLANGFQQVACVQPSRPMSPMPDFSCQIVRVDSDDTNEDDISVGTNFCVEATEPEPTFVQSDVTMETKPILTREISVDTIAGTSLAALSAIPSTVWNAPIPIFTNGNLCLPYLSLPYMDLLTDPSVLGYTIGTSNILFQQKRQLADILVGVEATSIEIIANDMTDLRRQITLTTEDLRFVDYIIRHVQAPKENAEGSEIWIREQFSAYALALVRTSLVIEQCKEVDHFNGLFMQAWRKTKCYQDWYDYQRPAIGTAAAICLENVTIGHPFAGTLSVADMKLKLAQTMHNSESGRKLNQAVSTTSRAVGGALSQAKGAFSNWWSSMTANQPYHHPQGDGEDTLKQPDPSQPMNDNSSSNSQVSLESAQAVSENDNNDEEISHSNGACRSDNRNDFQYYPNINDNLIDVDGNVIDSNRIIGEDLLQTNNIEGIVEIGKEATSDTLIHSEMRRHSGEIFTV